MDTGLIHIEEPETHFSLEAPGGLVQIYAFYANGKAQSIEVKNLPSFAEKLDVQIEVEGMVSNNLLKML